MRRVPSLGQVPVALRDDQGFRAAARAALRPLRDAAGAPDADPRGVLSRNRRAGSDPGQRTRAARVENTCPSASPTRSSPKGSRAVPGGVLQSERGAQIGDRGTRTAADGAGALRLLQRRVRLRSAAGCAPFADRRRGDQGQNDARGCGAPARGLSPTRASPPLRCCAPWASRTISRICWTLASAGSAGAPGMRTEILSAHSNLSHAPSHLTLAMGDFAGSMVGTLQFRRFAEGERFRHRGGGSRGRARRSGGVRDDLPGIRAPDLWAVPAAHRSAGGRRGLHPGVLRRGLALARAIRGSGVSFPHGCSASRFVRCLPAAAALRASREVGEPRRRAPRPARSWRRAADRPRARHRRLPEGARDVLVLVGIYGYSHGEAASALGVAEGTCKAQLHRARGLLSAALGLEEA